MFEAVAYLGFDKGGDMASARSASLQWGFGGRSTQRGPGADFNRIYCIDMKADHQTLFYFAVIAGKWQKNAPFDIKSPVKNFHGWAKGGASHRAP